MTTRTIQNRKGVWNSYLKQSISHFFMNERKSERILNLTMAYMVGLYVLVDSIGD